MIQQYGAQRFKSRCASARGRRVGTIPVGTIVYIQDGTRPLGGLLGGVEECDLLGDLGGEMLVEQSEEELLLAAEMVVDGALRESRLLGHLVQRRAVEAAPGVHPRRRAQKPGSRLSPPPAPVE